MNITMKHRWSVLPACALAAVLSTAAHANIYCAGKIAHLGLGQSGTVQVSVGYGVWYICDLSVVRNGFSTESCKGIYAGLLAARASDRSVSFYFTLPDGTACSSIGSWVDPNPAPYHVLMLSD